MNWPPYTVKRFESSLLWPIHIINPVDKTKLSRIILLAFYRGFWTDAGITNQRKSSSLTNKRPLYLIIILVIDVHIFFVISWVIGYCNWNYLPLRCHYDEILDIHFLHFRRTRQVFPRYFAKFQSATNIRICSFWTFIFENLRSPSIFLVQVLVESS